MHAILTVREMMRADELAVSRGISGWTLMCSAGRAVADAIRARWVPRPVLVLCGPGNNGGDGFVVAAQLADAGWPVRVAASEGSRTGDAALARAAWPGPVGPLTPGALEGAGIVVDALYGAGLARPVRGAGADVLSAASGHTVVAVDLPSGVSGDSGEVLGVAARADLTVTFFRRKVGHVLLPGRDLSGEILVADIGIPDDAASEVRTFLNGPHLWRLPRPGTAGHKYDRGHVLIRGGGRMTGASRLAARGALRVGAGLVTLAVPRRVWPVYAAAMPGALVEPADTDGEFAALLSDRRRNAVLIGPGAGGPMRGAVRAVHAAGRAMALDADALRPGLPEGRGGRHLMTPHEGEFARMFDCTGDRLSRARAAAAASGWTILLKGPETVVASPCGRAAVNDCAPAWLATAGSGDVLAGMAVGLMAQGLPAFEAGAAAAWLHGRAAARFGAGLIAEDLPDMLPAVLREPGGS